MKSEIKKTASDHVSPFEQIRRTNDAGIEYWSSRDFVNHERHETHGQKKCFV